MLRVTQLWSPPGTHRHRHPWHELIYVVSGDYKVWVDEREVEVPNGSSVVYPANVEHRPKVNNTNILLVQWRDRPNVGTDESIDELPRVTTDPRGAVRSAVHWLETWAADDNTDAADLDACLRVLLRLHAGSLDPAEADPVARARRYLASNLQENVTVDGIARNVGMSRSQLARAFRQRYGMSPMAWRRDCRLDLAMELLQDAGTHLDQIAHQTGYATGSHLSNLLWRERGIRPRDLRRGKLPPA